MDDAAAVLNQPSPQIRLGVKLGIAMLLGVSANAQDVKLNVTYVCSLSLIHISFVATAVWLLAWVEEAVLTV